MNSSIDELLERYYQTLGQCNVKGRDDLLAELADSSSEELQSSIKSKQTQAYTTSSSGEERRHLMDFLKTFPSSQWSGIMKRPLYRVAVLALMVMSAVICITGIDGVYSEPAWADVVDSLQAVTSARYKFSVEMPNSKPSTGTYWVHSVGRYREESNSGNVRIVNYGVGKILHLLPNQKKAVVVEIPEEAMGRQLVDYFLEIRKRLLNENTDVHMTREALGKRRIDSQDVIGFRIVSPERTTVIWGNPANGLPVRIEITKAGNLLQGAKVTLSEFDFNPTLDDGLFSVTPPADYIVETRTMSLAEPTEEDFVNALDSYSGLSKGSFPGKLDVSSFQELAIVLGFDKEVPQGKAMEDWMNSCEKFSRGFAFALGLPPEAKATYAGSAVGRGDSDKAIFWYQPVGSKNFRVLYADLTIRETSAKPEAHEHQPAIHTHRSEKKGGS